MDNRDNPNWKQFEKQVGQALIMAGYTVEYDCIIGAGQTDILAIKRYGTLTNRIVVECKYHEGKKSVSIDEVENFNARVLLLRTHDLADAGILVTNTAFTRNARKLVKNAFVELATLSNLYSRIFDFDPYLMEVVESFSRSYISSRFIPPRIKSFAIDVESEENIVQTFGGVEAEDEFDAIPYFKDWIDSKEGGRLCILGDYGAGKTSLCRWLAAHQAKKYLDNPADNRIPLLLPLHKFTKAVNVDALITDFVANECGITNFKLSAFRFLLEKGHFLILLDGFDEMARYVDQEVRYQTISELSKLGIKQSKVILTGRPSYFPTHEELMQILSGEKQQDIYAIAKDAFYELVEYDLVSLQLFNEKQILEYVKKCIPKDNDSKEIISYIKTTYNLIDLASRPVLLDMVVKSLPELLKQGTKVVVNAAKLYDIYTGLWLEREEMKGDFRKILKRTDKLLFMEEIAYQLFEEEKVSIKHVDLAEPIKNHFEKKKIDIEYLSHDIRTCSFLHRIKGKGYTFTHRSFQEFFYAKKILSDALKNNNESWKKDYLSHEVARFASELLVGGNSKIVEMLRVWLDEEPDSILGKNVLFVLLLSGNSVSKKIEELYEMEQAVLMGYAAFKLGDHAKGVVFWDVLYRQSSFAGRQRLGAYVSKSVEIEEIVHEAVYSLIPQIQRQPLLTKKELYAYISRSVGWATRQLARTKERARNKEVYFEDISTNYYLKVDEFFENQIADMSNPEIEVIWSDLLNGFKNCDPFSYELINMHYLLGLTPVEIAEKIDKKASVVRREINKAKKNLELYVNDSTHEANK